jgi:hypothetical protein
MGVLRQRGKYCSLHKTLFYDFSSKMAANFKSFDPQQPGRMAQAVTMIVHFQPPAYDRS